MVLLRMQPDRLAAADAVRDCLLDARELELMALLNYDADDTQSLALCAWKEARGEGQDGMRAVMHVIYHRALHWYKDSEHPVHDTVFAKNQFTSMSVPSDPEFNLEPGDSDAQYTYCVSIAPTVLEDGDPDPTGNALYYANLKTATSGWFFDHIVQDTVNHPTTATIGHQTFFK
jgi:hypothetical protein